MVVSQKKVIIGETTYPVSEELLSGTKGKKEKSPGP